MTTFLSEDPSEDFVADWEEDKGTATLMVFKSGRALVANPSGTTTVVDAYCLYEALKEYFEPNETPN